MTPGPWTVHYDKGTWWIDSDDGYIAVANRRDDAALMAAAPDLYAALAAIVDEADGHVAMLKIDAAHAALAQVTA